MALVLGGYGLQAGHAAAAAEIFRDARDRATAQSLPELAAQAELARASALLVGKQTDAAAVVYADAGALAESAGVALLAIEAYRMAGQLLLSHGREPQAVATWRRALAVADAAPPEQQEGSSASDVARALAVVCRRHGLQEQARALDEQAASYEAPPPPGSA